MTPVQKYRVYTLIVLLGSAYVLFTEGWDRWASVVQEVNSLGEKNSRIMTPEEIARHKLELYSELVSLRASLSRSSQGFDQGEAGLVELVGESARKSGVKVEALTPTKPEGEAGLAVTIELLGSFHRIASFLNTIENSPLVIRLDRLEFERDTRRLLRVKMAMKATFLRTNGQK